MKIINYFTPSSFCFGVSRAIEELEKIITNHPNEQIFCIHELVHNPSVNKKFKKLGIKFVERVEEVKDFSSIIVFSAHGTNRATIYEAEQKFQKVYNLECPLVTKIYREIEQFLDQGIKTFFYIGKAGHQEAQNVLDYINYRGAEVYNFLDQEHIPKINSEQEFAVLSQTTLNFKTIKNIFDQIKEKYPKAIFPAISDICKATFERQSVIQNNLDQFETLIVIGGKSSSNTKELSKIGTQNGKKVFFIENLEELIAFGEQIFNQELVAITGGASTPAEDIKKIFEYYQKNGFEGKILSL